MKPARRIEELTESILNDGRRPDCRSFSPPWFAGRWLDWHRETGCSLDDGRPRTPDGAREIAEGIAHGRKGHP